MNLPPHPFGPPQAMLRLALAVALIAMAGQTALAQSAAKAAPVIVFAAASLKTALDRVAADWQAGSGNKAAISYAGSAALAHQIEHDAPAELFVCADLDWMDYVAGKSLIKPETRSNLLGNRLVLIAASDNPVVLDARPDSRLGLDLAAALGRDGRLAIGDVRSVPAGKYGRAALEHLGAWPGVAGRLAQTENVRAALLLVARRAAPLGLVYQTDAVADPSVRIVALLPAEAHPPIVYPVALTAKATASAAALLAFLRSDKARAHFTAEGFTVID